MTDDLPRTLIDTRHDALAALPRYNQATLDTILAKVCETGVASLTAWELRIFDQAAIAKAEGRRS